MLITNRTTLHTLVANDRFVFLTDELFRHSVVPAKEFEKIAKDGYDISYVVRDGKKLVASVIYANLFLPLNETVHLVCKKYGLEYCMWEVLNAFPEKAVFRPIYLCTEKHFHSFEEKKPKRATKSPSVSPYDMERDRLKETSERVKMILNEVRSGRYHKYIEDEPLVADKSIPAAFPLKDKAPELIDESNPYLQEYKAYYAKTKLQKDRSF